MSPVDLDELRARVANIAAIDNSVLTAKAAHLLDRLIDEWANWELEQMRERASLPDQ